MQNNQVLSEDRKIIKKSPNGVVLGYKLETIALNFQ